MQRTSRANLAALLLVGPALASPPPQPNADDAPGEFIARWNEWVNSVDPSDRAFDLYQSFADDANSRLPEHLRDAREGDATWDELVEYLDAHRELIDTLLEAANRPYLGLELTDDPAAFEGPRRQRVVEPNSNDHQTYLLAVLAPHLGWQREGSRWLLAESRLCIARGDLSGAVQSLEANLWSARHAAEPAFAVCYLVRLAIISQTLAEVREFLARPGTPWSQGQLESLSVALASAAPDAQDAVAFERAASIDFLCFTFRSSPDGAFTPDVAAELFPLISELESMQDDTRPRGGRPSRELAYQMFGGDSVLPLHEQVVAANAFYDTVVSEMNRPWHEIESSQIGAAAEHLQAKPFGPSPHAPIGLILPAMGKFHRAALTECTLARGTLLTLALHRHHLRHGAWPPTLADLDPDLRRDDITDAHTGEPLLYKLTDAGPVVYSAGPDRDDDDARPLLDEDDNPDPSPPFLTIEEWQRRTADDPASIDGDWVLYPPEE